MYSKEKTRLLLDQEKVARARWWQEDTLVNNRLTWLLQSQVILFAAYGWVEKSTKDPNKPEELSELLNILPLIGLSICLIISISVNAAWKAQHILEKEYKQFTLGVNESTTNAGRVSGYLLPVIFLLSWGWLFHGFFGLLLFIFIGIFIIKYSEIWIKYLTKTS